jgi:hypothetical protein
VRREAPRRSNRTADKHGQPPNLAWSGRTDRIIIEGDLRMSNITSATEDQGASTKAVAAPIEDADPARELSRALDQFEAALSRKLDQLRRKRRVKPTARGVPPAGK